MDEPAKNEARNYLSAAGFFVISAYAMLTATSPGIIPNEAMRLVVGLGLLLIGTLLIVLRKRDMIALLFMMLSFFYIFTGFLPEFAGSTILLCFGGLIAIILLVTLTGKDKAKWLIILPPLLMIIDALVGFLSGTESVIFLWILFAVSMYLALACTSEKISLPGRKLLTADEETDFRASGSVLGYLVFTTTTGMYTVYYTVGGAMMNLECLHTIDIVAAVLLIVVAVLLFTVGKMRFTPVMFLLMGLVDLLVLYSSGAMFIGTGILTIAIGIFAILRKEHRILPGIMLLVYGCTPLVTAYAGGNMPVVSVILNAVPCLIAIYLAFAVYSQRKLPKF